MTEQECKELALNKWEWIVSSWNEALEDDDNWDTMDMVLPELEDLASNCSYCVEYSGLTSPINCPKCPLNDSGICCCFEYVNWENNKIKENAQKMLKRIEGL